MAGLELFRERSGGEPLDVNADRFRDLAIDAYFQDTPGHTDAGKVFLFLGSAFGMSKRPAWTSSGDDLIDGKYGTSITALGDLNRDGYEDLLIGSKQKENGQVQSGKVYLYLGGPRDSARKRPGPTPVSISRRRSSARRPPRFDRKTSPVLSSAPRPIPSRKTWSGRGKFISIE